MTIYSRGLANITASLSDTESVKKD